MVEVTEHTCIYIPGRAIPWGPELTPFMTTLALARRQLWGDEVHYRLHTWARQASIISTSIEDPAPPWDNLMALIPPDQRLEAIRHAFFHEPQALIIPDPVILNWHHTTHPAPLTYNRDGQTTGGGWITPTETYTLTLKTLTHTGADPTHDTSWRVPTPPLADLTETITLTHTDPNPTKTEIAATENQLLARAGLNRTHVWATQQPWPPSTPQAKTK